MSNVSISPNSRSLLTAKKLELERDRFGYAMKQGVQNLNAVKERSDREAVSNQRKIAWELLQQNKQIEMQNKALLTQLWTARLNATAMVQQPVSVNGNTISGGSVASGDDKVKCLNKFKNTETKDLNTR